LSTTLFPLRAILVIAIATTAGIILSMYPLGQIVTGISQSSQFPLSLPPPQSQQQQQQNSTTITTNGTSIFDLESHLLNSIFNQVQNSVVQITSTMPIPQPTTPYPNSPPNNPNEDQNATALGSGFVYSDKGYLITNYHVISNANTVDVTFTDGNRYTASVIGKDPLSDIAVLKIIENLNKPIVPLNIANSTNIKVGDKVIAIGNPYGLDNTMTTGIVSQTGRLIQEPSGISITDAIQTDAPLNPGNSGGPLLNIKGQVIGINTAGESERVGFAVSSNTIVKEVPILIQDGNFTHSYLGIDGTTLTSDLTSQFNNISKTFRGVYVNTIIKDGPADKAGIRGATTDYYGQKHGGDIITAVDNQNITKMDQLVTFINQNTRPGDTTTITVYRDGHYMDLKVDISARPLSPSPPK
jgi:S1-C subfamily serine protease